MTFRFASHIPAVMVAAALAVGALPVVAAQSLRSAEPLESLNAQKSSSAFVAEYVGPNNATDPAPAKPSPGPNGKVIEVKRPNGKPARKPREDLWLNYLDWLSRRQGPESAVNSVDLEGTSEDERAVITATVKVQIRHDEGWVRVPLFFNEAVIEKSETRFLGDRPFAEGAEKQAVSDGRREGDNKPSRGQSAFSDLAREGGYRWWFRGKGYHRLTLTLIVPVDKAVGQRRLRLSLPPLAAASNLRLRVADASISATGPKGADVRVRAAGPAASDIFVVGMREQLDLQWRSLPTNTGRREFLQAETSMLVNLTEETVELKVLQRVQSTGPLSRLQVVLPSGFLPISAKGKFVKSFQVDGKNRATVEFTEPRNEPTDIVWILEKPFPARGGRLAIEGLNVEQADEQTVELAVVKVPGWRIEKPEENHGAVRRIRIADFGGRTLIEKATLSAAYRLLRRPFQITLEATPIQPHVTSTPHFRMHITGKQIQLVGEFRIRVSEDGGAVEEISVLWPGWKSAGWEIRPAAASSVFQQTILSERGDKARIRYRLAGSRRGEFVIPLQAELTVDSGKRVAIRLPRVTADVAHPAELQVSRAADVVLDLTDAEDLPLVELTDRPAEHLMRRYQLETTTAELSTRVTVHPQTIKATADLEVTPKPFGVTTRQRIKLTVDYVPLATILLSVPADLAERISFFHADGRPATAVRTAGKNNTAVIEVRLPKPMLGLVELTAVFSVNLPNELPPGGTAPLSIPIVKIAGLNYDYADITTPNQAVIELSVSDEIWRRTPTLDGTPKWTTPTPAAAVTAQLRNPHVVQNRPFSISRAIIHVEVDQAGQARYRAQYRILKDPHRVVLTIPEGCKLDGVWWDRRSVLERVEQQAGREGLAIQIPAPDGTVDPSRGRLLTLEYHSRSFDGGDWIRQFDFVAPRFTGPVWIEQLVWRVMMPRNQHLSSYSREYFGEFRWQRTGVTWNREAPAPFDAVATWIGSDDGPDSATGMTGNSYVFRRFGSFEGLQVRAISRSVIVLWGAGLAWLIGVLLARFSRLRSAFVFLTLVLVAAVSSLLFPTECQLLLQPAVMGLLLAGGFVWIDRRYRPAVALAPVAVAVPGDYLLTTPERSPSLPVSQDVHVGSEDLTAVGLHYAEPVGSATEFRRPD